MTVTRQSMMRYSGLTADTKPTTYGGVAVETNAVYLDTQLFLEYVWDGAAWNLRTEKAVTETLTNKTIVEERAYAFIFYNSSGTYKLKNTRTGAIDSSDADPTVVLQYAINNMPDAVASGTGGIIFAKKGTYSFTTTGTTAISIDATTTNCHGIIIEGEGKSTKFDFAPASSLTNAFNFKIHNSGLRNLYIKANANVTNLIKINGNGQDGILDNVIVEGATSTPTTNQIGLLDDGTTSASYGWKIFGCRFDSLDICMKYTTVESNEHFIWDCKFINFNTGIDCATGLHNISHLFFQASASLGDRCIIIRAGDYNGIYDIVADSLSKASSQVIELTSGANFNTIVGVTNSGTGGIVLDNSGVITNLIITNTTMNLRPGIISANMHFVNNTGIFQRDSGATARQTFRLNTSNQLDIGDTAGITAIRMFPGTSVAALQANSTGTVDIGANARIRLSDSGLTAQRTITWNDANTIVVGEANTQTLTNKTLTSPIISSISNTGTITLPTSTDTLTGKATTDTLTNKTINAASNTFQNIQSNPFYSKKTGGFYPRGLVTAGDGMFTGMLSGIAVGAGPPTFSGLTTGDVNGMNSVLDTSATINNLAGWKCTTLTCRRYNPVIMFRFKLTQTTAMRLYAGFSSTGGTNPASNSDYLNALSGVGLWYDSAVSANWKVMHNDGSGASVVDDTSTAADTAVHTLSITAIDATPSFVVALDGATMTNGTVTGADQPAQTTLMSPIFYIENTAAASKTCTVYKEWIEADL